MIRVDVQPYCNCCIDFTPDLKTPERVYYSSPDGACEYEQVSDMVVRCKYRKRCENMVRYLQKQIDGRHS